MAKELGNNFWLMDDGMVYNSKTKWLVKPENLPFRIDGGKMRKKLPFEEGINFRKMKDGYRFVMIDFCESIKSHKKTTNLNFLKFTSLNKCWRKYNSIKEKDGWVYFDYDIQAGKAYQLMCEVNHEFRDDLRILKFKELKQDEKT